MPVFVIGMRRYADRYLAVLEKLKSIGVDAQPFEGVDLLGGDTLAPEEKIFKYTRFLTRGWHLSLGIAGCYFAHYRLMKHILALNVERAVIMECDAVFQPELHPLLREIERLDLEQYELILLHHRFGRRQYFRPQSSLRLSSRPDTHLHLLYGPSHGTAAYAITRGAVKRLLPQLVPMTEPIDIALSRPFITGLRSYVVQPACVAHGEVSATSILSEYNAAYRPANPVLACLDLYFCKTLHPLTRRWRRLANYCLFSGWYRRWCRLRRRRQTAE